jgi:hypothetical protein
MTRPIDQRLIRAARQEHADSEEFGARLTPTIRPPGNFKMLGTIGGDIIGSVHEHTGTKSTDFDLFVAGSYMTSRHPSGRRTAVHVEAACRDSRIYRVCVETRRSSGSVTAPGRAIAVWSAPSK